MRKILLPAIFALSALAAAAQSAPAGDATTMDLGGKTYDYETISKRTIGPGVIHQRLRIPAYPLNVNLLTVDLTNPYNRVETTTANEKSRGTESLVGAAKRQSSEGHRAIAGANANFWVVPSQPEGLIYNGIARNASVRNGKMVVESNQHRDQWDGGTMRTGVVSMSYDKTAHIDFCTSTIKVTNPKIGTMEVHQCNKGIRFDELCMYNSFYGADTKFLPISDTHREEEGGDATEVLLDMDEGYEWTGGNDMVFTVREVRLDAGKGTLGAHDLALVGRGDNRTAIAALAPGDRVTMRYSWTYNPGTEEEVTPLVEQAVGGNAMVMRKGELTKFNETEAYNSQIYSRTGYGCSADGKMLYIIVIDKSTDPVYGTSAGCNTATMCEIARYFGCYNMANFDAGGSAEMLVDGAIVNRTTEGNPRAVANGWLVYSTAPEDDNTVTAIEFDQSSLKAPIYSTFSPVIRAYNKYGAVVTPDLKGFTLSCDPALGSCEGESFTAAGTSGEGVLTAEYNGVKATATVSVMEAQMGIRVKSILIDATRRYPMEVEAELEGKTYSYNPANITWTVDDPSVAVIDESGVLSGLAEGHTTVKASVGSFSDEAEVTVEIAPEARMEDCNLGEWTVKASSGMTGAKMAADGTVSYTYATPRDPNIQISGTKTFYSLPDRIRFEFESSLPVTFITVDFRAPANTRANLVKVLPAEGETFAAATPHVVDIPISLLGSPDDIALYPLSIRSLKLTTTTSTANKGEQTMRFKALYAEYDNYASAGIDAPAAAPRAAFAMSPNPVDAGCRFYVRGADISLVEIYNAAGVRVARHATDGKAEVAGIDAPSAPGTYFVRVNSAEGFSTAIMIVK